jgi:predicted short-subunit dehydrogenase-like oxidoreductase (DUF2520 family)
MKISIIGAGNVAWHLAHQLEEVGHSIEEIWSRDFENAQKMAEEMYDANALEELNFSESSSRFFIIAVADDAIETIIKQLVLPENSIIVHTSGTKSLSEFENWLNVYSDIKVKSGVLYPLQTFTKKLKIDFEKQVPICVEASDPETEDVLVKMAQDLSETAYIVNSRERKTLHLAAVIACNFTNHLWVIAKELMDEEELNFGMIKPLIKETMRKAMFVDDPAFVQTGPARRGDIETLENHKTMLKNKTENVQKIYEEITESILKKYN